MDVRWLFHVTVWSVWSSASRGVHQRRLHRAWESVLPATHLPRLPFLIQFSLCRPFAFTAHVTVQIRKNEDYHLCLNRTPPTLRCEIIPVSVSRFKSLNSRLRQSNPICFPRISVCPSFFPSFCASPHRSPDLKQNVFGAELGASNNESFKFPLWGRYGSWDEKKVWKPTRCDCLWWNSSLLLLLALWPPA